MTLEKLDEIIENHKYSLPIEREDVLEVLYFVEDLLREECEEIRENEPYATVSIGRLETGVVAIADLGYAIDEIMEE